MPSLVVGGVTIPVAISSPAWSRSDAVDRGRLFDGTFFASESGGASRDWTFSTPPVTQADAETYIAALSSPAAKLCSGDIIQIPTMCSPELPSGKPTRAGSGNRVVLDFMLHESQPAKVLLRYAPGDTITGESFTRSTVAHQINASGVLVSKAVNTKRDGHYVGGVLTTLLEDTRTTGLTFPEGLDNAAWTKSDTTISANVTTAPDGTATADKIVETATTAQHAVIQGGTSTANALQSFSVFVRAGERTWVLIETLLSDATAPRTWINLSTGAVGTKAAGHTVAVTAVSTPWYRVEVVVNTGTSGGAISFRICPTTGDTVVSYLGDITKGIYAWGAQHEQDKPFASSYIPVGITTRGVSSYSLPFTTPPQELTLYAKFIESGSSQIAGARIAQISNAAGGTPRLVLYNPATAYGVLHTNATGDVSSVLGAAPVNGNTVELMARLFGDGSVDITQSINGGAATTGAQSAANVLANALAGPLAWLNSAGTSGGYGFVAFQSFKVLAGARSLTEMRAT